MRIGHTQENYYSLHGFFDKTTNISKFGGSEPKFANEEYQEYLRLKSNNLAQSSTTTSLAIALISQFVESQNSWIIYSSASDDL